MFNGNWDGSISPSVKLSPRQLTVIAGPCMLESLELGLNVGRFLQEVCMEMGFQYIFKASFDKANRTSKLGVRGPGFEKGLEWLGAIRDELKLPILTDVHTADQVGGLAKVCDVLQVPAFLCVERSLVEAVAQCGKTIQLKKGQHLSVEEMFSVARIIQDLGNNRVIICERGSCFGYNNLVVDYRNLHEVSEAGFASFFDATHSAQLPGAGNGASSGLRHVVPALARAAVAVGVEGLFLEVHENPAAALSDADTQLDFELARQVLKEVRAVHAARQ
jgi:2-dehydro-3-deoxyphosphooctonate aldolase (KDO 8-P synthase)